MNAPREPQGAGSLVGWLRGLLRYAKSLQIQSGRGYKVKRGPYGTILQIERGGGGTPGTSAKRYSIQSIHDGYLTCRENNAGEIGETDVLVAMPYLLRVLDGTRTIDGVDVDYEKVSSQKRTASIDSASYSETQVIVPRYLAEDDIYAIEPEGGTGVTVSETALVWLDINSDARAWAKEYP